MHREKTQDTGIVNPLLPGSGLKEQVSFIVASYAVCWAAVYLTCRYTLVLTECITTYYSDWGIIKDTLCAPGGFVTLCAGWLVQWFTTPALAVSLTALLLTGVAMASYAVLECLSSRRCLWPLALAVPLSMILPLGDVHSGYTAVVAMTLDFVSLWCVLMRRNKPILYFAVSAGVSLILVVVVGAYAMLFALVAALAGVTTRKGWYAWLCPIMVYALAVWQVRQGYYPDLWRALTPAGYYTPWMQAPLQVCAPAIVALLLVAVSLMTHRVRLNTRRLRLTVMIALAVAVGAVGTWTLAKAYDEYDRHFVELMTYCLDSEWDKVTDRCKEIPMQDVRLQNCLSVALANQGRLADRLFYYPCQGVESLCASDRRDPVMYMLLSDIYYTMGNIAQAQRLAFEANEALGNHSPRMLQRLADTAIIYGNYAVVDRYLFMLRHTRRYAGWAADRQLKGEAVEELLAKRACLLPEDRFAEVNGLADDLRRIAMHNPSHTATLDYLGMMCLLERNLPKFVATMDYFYDNGLTDRQLPTHFQEALAMASLASNTPLDVKYRLHPSVKERCQAHWTGSKPQPHSVWQYLKVQQR